MKTPELPLRVGSYDDAGEVNDDDGVELFTFGCNDDTGEMDEHTQAIADWVMYRLNNFDKVVTMLRLVEKNSPNLGGSWHGQIRNTKVHELTEAPVLAGWTNQHGPTPLIAAMRCLVSSKLGCNVDVPEELCQSQSN